MKIKTLVAVLLLSGGVTSTFAQSDCNANSSISHEAVRAKNFKDAYAPCMAVLKDCPTLRYYTYTDAQKILTGLMSQIKDRNSAEYKKLFDELMAVHDQKMKYIPEFASKMKGVPSVASALGTKAVDYLQYAPAPDLNQAYAWLKESAETAKGESDGAVLHYFVDVSMQKVKADTNHTDQFFQDYINASQYADDAIAAEDNAKKKAEIESGISIVFEELDSYYVNAEQELYTTLLKAYQKLRTEKVENIQNLIFVYVKNWFIEKPIAAKVSSEKRLNYESSPSTITKDWLE